MLLENPPCFTEKFRVFLQKQRVFRCFLPVSRSLAGENKFSLVDSFRNSGVPSRFPPRHNTTSRSASTKRLQKRMEFGNFGFNKRKWRSLPLLGDAKQPLPSLFGPCPIALGGERDHVSRNRAMKMGNKKKVDPR